MSRGLCFGVLIMTPTFAFCETRSWLESLQLSDLNATRERPLFTFSRRPTSKVGTEAQTGEKVEMPPQFDLIGTIISRDNSCVLLRNRVTSEIIQVEHGEVAGKWRVEAVKRRSVLLIYNKSSMLLSLPDILAPGIAEFTLKKTVNSLIIISPSSLR